MEKRVFIMTFDEDSKSYQAFSHLKEMHTKQLVVIEQMAVVKNTGNDHLQMKDFIDVTGADKTARGSLIGLLIGILGGPMGILLGWVGGTAIGARRDAKEVQTAMSVFEQTLHIISEGKTGVILIADALSRNDLRRYAEDKLNGRILQLDYDLVMTEIEQAQETEKELEHEAKKRWFDKKK